jgi:toxin HigB-1
MIRSFGARETELVWRGLRSRRLPDDVQRLGKRKMEMIDAAETVEDLREPPSNKLELLRGDRRDFLVNPDQQPMADNFSMGERLC